MCVELIWTVCLNEHVLFTEQPCTKCDLVRHERASAVCVNLICCCSCSGSLEASADLSFAVSGFLKCYLNIHLNVGGATICILSSFDSFHAFLFGMH